MSPEQLVPGSPSRLAHLTNNTLITVVIAAVALAACGSDESGESTDSLTTTVEAQILTSEPAERTCSGAFVRHDLDHVTTPRAAEVAAMTDGTGAGVLLDDLDDDGAIDIVLPNLSGPTSIFWNRGASADGPQFDRADLADGRFRQAIVLDVDIDGDRDVLLSTGVGPPVAFIHDGDRDFERTEFRTRAVAYSMAPGDLDGDGTVEVVTGSYNAELTANRDNRALTGTDVGVAVHFPTGDNLASGVEHEFLTDTAQALATMVVDIDGDGLDDVVVGNDLGTPDRIWLGSADLPGVDGLTVTELFDITSLSTMSIDVADIDNDGDRDLVSTDMARLPGEPDSVWEGVEADIEQAQIDDVQIPRNIVQLADGDAYAEAALDLGVAATGWSWSGVLGDLDDDGLLDLYVVNGMQATAIFDMLPDGELIEPNQAFQQTDNGFDPMPDWGLASTDGGRGMAQADLDGDGDLDIVVNNLGTASTLWENQLCSDRDAAPTALVIEPVWTGVQNVDALGTVITVDDDTVTRTRIITGTRGYISTGATRAHFGLGVQPDLDTVSATIRWPDGAVTALDDLPAVGTHRVERTAPPVQPVATIDVEE